MESQRIVFMEELHHCAECERLVCRVTRKNGKHSHIGCECEDDKPSPETSAIVEKN